MRLDFSRLSKGVHKTGPASGTSSAGLASMRTSADKSKADMLALFRFDLVQQDINDGCPAEQLHRVNNMAWRLITTRGYAFDEAITAAAVWVHENPPSEDEATFVDVMALFKRMTL